MKIAVSVSIGTKPLNPQVEKIASIISTKCPDYVIILAGHEILDPVGSAMAHDVVSHRTDTVIALANEGSFSSGYLAGWEKGVQLGADFIIAMDADGSHDPLDILRFIDLFEQGHKVICSTRFSKDARDEYPWQRQLMSKGVTLLSNLFLVSSDKSLTDFASGYEGLSRQAVIDLFKLCPPKEWLSVTVGPYHLQNTILRLLLTIAGYKIYEMPISYGVMRKGKVLGLGYVFRALYSFWLLVLNKKKYFAKGR